MTFTSAITNQTVFGDKKVHSGTFTNSAGGTGGDIVTGLKICEFISLQAKSAAVVANAPVVNEALPIAGSAITIVTDGELTGNWFAFGW